MSKVLITQYLHSNKESNFELVDLYEIDSLKYLGYEVELIWELDLETKETKLVGCEGRTLGPPDNYSGLDLKK